MWFELSIGEMKAFFGILMTMGLVKLPNMHMYWDTTTSLFNIPGVQEIMKLQKFRDILSCLQLRDSKFDTEDKICKIQPVVTTIISNSQFHYRPKQYIP